jgi:hypothetical protein
MVCTRSTAIRHWLIGAGSKYLPVKFCQERTKCLHRSKSPQRLEKSHRESSQHSLHEISPQSTSWRMLPRKGKYRSEQNKLFPRKRRTIPIRTITKVACKQACLQTHSRDCNRYNPGSRQEQSSRHTAWGSEETQIRQITCLRKLVDTGKSVPNQHCVGVAARSNRRKSSDQNKRKTGLGTVQWKAPSSKQTKSSKF